VLPVGVEGDHARGAPGDGEVDARLQRRALTQVDDVAQHDHARDARLRDGVVARAVVDHDHAPARRDQLTDHRPDGLALVERRDHAPDGAAIEAEGCCPC
jgi:hypothetical protein